MNPTAVPRIHRIIAAPTLLAISLLSAISLSVSAQAARPGATVDQLVLSADRGRILGAESAPLWLLIVSDFQCPYCRQWHRETWETLRREFVVTGKVRVAYMNFPLGIHPNARPAALAAMCGATQGKFWEVTDRIFETQDQWKDIRDPAAFFRGIATRAGVPAAVYDGCVANPAIGQLVDADYARMARAGASSTPTFFVGRVKIEGAQPIDAFRRAIASELAAATKRP